MLKIKYLLISVSILFLAAISVFSLCSYNTYYNPGDFAEDKVIYITKGTGFTTITEELVKLKAIRNPMIFEVVTRIKGSSAKIQAGEFLIPKNSSPFEIIEILTTGKQIQHKITIAEGLTIKEVLLEVSKAPLLDKEVIPEVREGELLPETYNYTWNEKADVLIERMRIAMTQEVATAWEKRQESILKDPKDLIILASIIEKETSLESERTHIASVFVNRLKLGMPLQSDPTVIYGLEVQRDEPIQELSRKDLTIDTEYNSYLHLGLPPTPICCPGKASLVAAANPDVTEDLYFVADGNGGHVFSKTYKEHAENHKKWRKIRSSQEKKS